MERLAPVPTGPEASLTRAIVEERLALARTGGTIAEYQMALHERLRALGEEVPVVKPAPVGDGAALETYSPVERAHIQAALRAEEELLRTLMEAEVEEEVNGTREEISDTLVTPAGVESVYPAEPAGVGYGEPSHV